MLSIERAHAAILECHGAASVLDAMPAWPQVHACRVAPDELLLVAPPAMAHDLLQRTRAQLASVDSGSLVFDQSDGWAVFSLRGAEALRPLAQLSVNPFPRTRPAFVQGAVAGGAAKVLLLESSAHILVPFPLREHVAGRLSDVCGPSVRISSGEVPFSGDAATTAEHTPPVGSR